MKRELVAIGLSVLMVVTVIGAFAVTAKPANALTITNPTYTLTPGVSKLWFSPQFNYQYTRTGGGPPGWATSASITDKTLLAAAVSAPATSYYESYGYCVDGITWYLNPSVSWAAVQNRPVLVKALVSYNLSGGGSGRAGGDVFLGNYPRHWVVVEHREAQAAAYSVNQPLKLAEWTTTLSALATGPGQGQLYVFAGAYVYGSTAGSTHSSTHVTVYALGLQWL
jgi:hypothetical protein